jgi:hypothetical protein
MFKGMSALAAGGLVLGLLAGAPVAFAAENGNAGNAAGTEQGTTAGANGANGVTSGPAVGTPVAPSGAVQKHARHGRTHKAVASAEAAGAPGVNAKRGTEAGTAPRHHRHMKTASRHTGNTGAENGMGNENTSGAGNNNAGAGTSR